MHRSLRRLAGVPAPEADEAFGSWLIRLAHAHHASLDDFVAALLREGRLSADTESNYYHSPSTQFLQMLSVRTGWPRVRFTKLLIPAGLRPPRSKDSTEQPFCRQCWGATASESKLYFRRYWGERWGVMCEEHQSPLASTLMPLDDLFTASARLSVMHWPDPDARCFDQPLNVAMSAAQREVRALDASRKQPVKSRKRARVLRDLALIAGTRFSGESLVTWSLWQQGVSNRQLFWRDGRDPQDVDTATREPSGPFQVRRLALRVATLLMLDMERSPQIRRPEDVMIRGLLQNVGPQTGLAWAINARRRGWSDHYKAQWNHAFCWSDERDPVVWARRETTAIVSQIRKKIRNDEQAEKASSDRRSLSTRLPFSRSS